MSYQPDAPLAVYQAPQTSSVVTDANGFIPETTFKSSAGIIDRSPLNENPTLNPVLTGSGTGFGSGDTGYRVGEERVSPLFVFLFTAALYHHFLPF